MRRPIPARPASARPVSAHLARLLPVAVLILLLLQMAVGLHWFGLGAAPADTPVPIGGPFRLVAPDGRTVTDRAFRGRWMLVYFGYTQCPDTCPTALNDMADALGRLGGIDRRVAPLFITVDPAHDTPAAMGAYAAKFDRRILGLTGTAAEIAQVMREYKVYAAPDSHATPDHMVMDHSSAFMVMDPQGRFVDVLTGASAQAIADRLRTLAG